MSSTLKLALVGCGNIAQQHWNGIQRGAPRIRVTAAVDANPALAEAMAQRAGARAFTSLDDALAHGDFDAVDIMLPHHLHEEAATKSFAAGKHVCLEKPMAHTLESALRILATAKASGLVFSIAEQSQFWPDALLVQKLLREGAIGEVFTARAVFLERALPVDNGKPWRYVHAYAGGGITIDGGAHWIRPLRMWLGDIDEVVAVTARTVPQMDDESLARALLRFKSGVLGSYENFVAGTHAGWGEEFRLTGTRGEIIIDQGFHGRVRLYNAEHPQGHVFEAGGRRGAGFAEELDEFSRAVLDGAPLIAPPEVSLGEMRTALAIYRSAASRQWEKV